MSFFSELTRRNVLRVGFAYIAAIWALIEGSDTIVSIINGPPWIPQVVLVSGVLGFPVALLLAWFYEWTAEGIKAAADARPREAAAFTGRRIDFAIIGLLVIAVAFLIVDNYVLLQPVERERSIAVLPFENRSSTEEQDAEFFSTGMHDALLTQLAKLSDVRVISRTSVLEYADTPKNLRTIGEELGVATILEGRVLRDGDAVQIIVQLIDAETDEHLWAQTFEGELMAESVFGLQREMAMAIAGALQATLSSEDINQLDDVPTHSTEALSYYLSAVGYGYTPGDHVLRVAQYLNAVEADPNFAQAWAGLTKAYLAVAGYVDDPAEAERLRSEARRAAQKAMELAPELADTHIAKGIIHSEDHEYEAALEEYAVAERLMPGNAWVYYQRASLLRRLGEYEEAIRNYGRAQVLDPRDSSAFTQQGHVYAWLRDYEHAEQAFDGALALYPDNEGANPRKILLQEAKGDLEGMKAAVEAEALYAGPRQARRWRVAFYERERETALGILDEWETDEEDKADLYGLTWKFLFDMPDRAEPYFQLTRARAEQFFGESPDDPGDPEYLEALVFYAETLGYLGERDAALAAAGRVMASLPDTVASYMPEQELHLKLIWALIAAGDHASAIAGLDHYLQSPAWWSIEGLQLDPRLDPIRERPDFLGLVEKYARD